MDRLGKRRLVLLGSAGAMLAFLAFSGPVANVKVELSDTAAPRIEAAVDLGVLGFSVLYTWTQKRVLR